MAISTDFDYAQLLALDKAKLMGRERLNRLGSDELIISYMLQNSGAKEDCLEWLETNRLTLTNPQVSFKTYEGEWHCVNIVFDEDRKSIIQTFKIDSSMTNDVAQRSQGGISFKDYYWRVVNPEKYNIPAYVTTGTSTPSLAGVLWYDTHTDLNGENVYRDASETYSLWNDGSNFIISAVADEGGSPTDYFSSAVIEGIFTANGAYTGSPTVGFDNESVWSKTANDNGDGTYDVVISRSELRDLSGSSEGRSWGESPSLSKSIFITGARNFDANQEYELYYEYASVKQLVPADSGLDGVGWYDTGTTENSLPVYYDSSDTYANWYDGSNYIVSTIADVGGTPTNFFESPTLIGSYDGNGSFTGDFKFQSSLDYVQIASGSLDPMGPKYAEWRGKDNDDWRIIYATYSSFTAWWLTAQTSWGAPANQYEANHPYTNLNSSEWYDENTNISGFTGTQRIEAYRNDLIVQIGKNPPKSSESTTVSTATSEQSFVSEGGTVPDPTSGQSKTIQNTPLENGLFRVTISTVTANRQRIPALMDSIVYASNINFDKNAVIVGVNATYEEFQKDVNLLLKRKYDLQNSVAVSLNRFGLYDYTIRAMEV